MVSPSPRVSVIIPTYKHANFILNTLNSVFAQAFTDYEIIVVNDGSPDNTKQVLNPLVQAGRIRYFEQENQGQSAARNRGIAEANGTFIALLDDDDLWPSDKLQWQVEALEQNPDAALVYGRVQCIDGEGGVITPFDTNGLPHSRLAGKSLDWLGDGPSGDVHDSFCQTNYIVSPGQCLIRRQFLGEKGGAVFDPKVTGGSDDWDLYIRLSLHHKFLYKTDLALLYRLHGTNASLDTNQMLWSTILVYRNMVAMPAKSEAQKRQRRAKRDEFTAYFINNILDNKESQPLRTILSRLVPVAANVPGVVLCRLRVKLGQTKHKLIDRRR